MSLISGTSVLSLNDLYTSSSQMVGGLYLGQLQPGVGGSWFRYAKAGASDLIVGNMLQSSAIDTQFDDMAVPASVASGFAQGVVITNGTTAVTAGSLTGAAIEVSVTPGLGESYTILDNSAALSGAALTLYFDRPIRTAWTTSTKVTVRQNPWSAVIQAPATTLTGTVAGNAIYAIPATKYGWVQTGGVGAALSDATSILVGSALVSPSGTAGAVTLGVAGKGNVGYAMRAAATGKTIPVFFQID